MNLLNIFKKQKKEQGEIKSIELYCQNPQCQHPLILKGEYVAEMNGALVHSNPYCIEMYMCHKTLNSQEGFFLCSSINYMPYNKAEFLAEKGKIKYSKLEDKTGESQ